MSSASATGIRNSGPQLGSRLLGRVDLGLGVGGEAGEELDGHRDLRGFFPSKLVLDFREVPAPQHGLRQRIDVRRQLRWQRGLEPRLFGLAGPLHGQASVIVGARDRSLVLIGILGTRLRLFQDLIGCLPRCPSCSQLVRYT